jgi:hypothetical protein
VYIHLREVLSRKFTVLFCKIVFLSYFLADFPVLLFIQFQIKKKTVLNFVLHHSYTYTLYKNIHTYLPCITLVHESACNFIEEALTLSVASNQHIMGLVSSFYILSRLTLLYG